MDFSEWEPVYTRILSDFGFDRSSDEASVRVLKAVTMNSDLRMGDEIGEQIGDVVSVIGNGPNLKDEIPEIEGTVIASGSAVEHLGSVPDIIFTDLDGDIESQIDASRNGAVTFIHAHGDNVELIQRYASSFTGPVVLTTQSKPELTVYNYGGFTDGDRAYCFAKHFGAKKIKLIGFDFENPTPKPNCDISMKKKKLIWAEKIIVSL